MRFRKTLVLAALTSLMAVGCASTAGAKTLTASAGGIHAKLTFGVRKKTHTIGRPHLVVTTAWGASDRGSILVPACGSGYYCSHPTLQIATLSGVGKLDGAHAAVVSLYSGGAHCCEYAVIDTPSNPTSGSIYSISHDFGDSGFLLKDLGHNGQKEFETADDRFAYLLSDYADSGLPIEVLNLQQGKLKDVTRDYPALIKRDAARYWKGYERDHSGEQIGQFAPWAADEDNLGNQSVVATRLSAQVATGRITAVQAQKLRRYLMKFGYTQ